ncbi:MAG: SIS domain-containing protein [Phycisphaeraceae bacterium]|nr:SIS domain-containing protein [Phycisphaeraceae bacterium]
MARATGQPQPAGSPAAAAPASRPAPASPPATHIDDLALARRALDAQSRALAGLSARLDARFSAALDLIERCAATGGTVLVTGLGKSGLIGAKIAATLTSLGIPSHFVHPSEAAHGDLGNFRKSDLCLALSYSGETDEVISLAACLRQDGIPVISITAGPRDAHDGPGGLDHLASVALHIGRVEEAADLSPAPTVSTTAMLALGDALALCASARLNFTHDDFARRHPGGALGGLLKPVTEALRFTVGRNYAPIPETATVAEALAAAEAVARRPGALLLVNAQGVLTGIFTDADLRRLILKDPALLSRPIAQYMTRSPGSLPHTARVRDAVRMVREFRRDEIPVVDDHGRPIGILDVQDLIAMRLVKE